MARKPPWNHGAYKIQASLTSSTLLTEMEQQWHEPQKLNNENNLQLKNVRKNLFFGPLQVGVTGLSQYLP